MFLRTQAKGTTSELINLSNAVCVTHRRWHDSDQYTVTANFTPERIVQDTVILTRPMSLQETETVIEMITGGLQAGTPLLDLREFGDHAVSHDTHRTHHTVSH